MANSYEKPTAEQVRIDYREQFFVADLVNPTVVDAAGDDGLVQAVKLGNPLAVTIPVWDDRPPAAGLVNTLTMEWKPASSDEFLAIGSPEDIPGPDDPTIIFPLNREIPLGELRMDQGKAGGWIRAYGNKFDVSSGSGVDYQQTQQGLSFGADAPLPIGDGQWLVGLLGGYSKSELDLSHGTSGTVDSYSVGAYTTWLDQPSGYYFDGVLKFNRFQNKSDVHLSDGKKTKGNYDNNGVGASLEFGRHIKLADDYFIEPYTQLSGVIIQGQRYELDNGLIAEGDRTRSLLGKIGTTAGRNFNLGEGNVVQPYIRVAYAHEFAKNNEVEVNNNVFNNDLSGSRGELGAGIAMTLTDKVSLHADVDYSNGDKIEQPWGFNIGARYSW